MNQTTTEQTITIEGANWIKQMNTPTETHITIEGVAGLEGLMIPRYALATYTPRANLRTPPTLLLEWGNANVFFTGRTANDVRLQLLAKGIAVETILQVEVARHV